MRESRTDRVTSWPPIECEWSPFPRPCGAIPASTSGIRSFSSAWRFEMRPPSGPRRLAGCDGPRAAAHWDWALGPHDIVIVAGLVEGRPQDNTRNLADDDREVLGHLTSPGDLVDVLLVRDRRKKR